MRRSGVARRGAATTRTRTRTTTGRPGTSSRGVAAPAPSPASGGARPTASSFPAQLRAGLGAAAARSTQGRREAPAGRYGPRARHPARRGLHVKEGSGPRQTPRAPLRPPGARGLPRPGGAVTGRAGAEGRARRRRRPLLGPAAPYVPAERPVRACVCVGRGPRGGGRGGSLRSYPGGDFARWFSCSGWTDLGGLRILS